MQTPATSLQEVRIHGLNKSITTEALGEFLGKGVRIRGVLLHPQEKGLFQWAQVWVSSEAEVMSLLALRDALAVNGITISRTSAPTNTPPYSSWDLISQLSKLPKSLFSAPPNFSTSTIHESNFTRQNAMAHLPRNLYVLNLPLDLTQTEFKDLFLAFGMVEHSILLSQLDGIGRRRGFVLMSSHHDAVEVMQQMHGKWIDGSKLDVSWALVQREAKAMSTLPNRVVHPPAVSTRRESSIECAVIVEDIDPFLFPDTAAIAFIFKSFGPIARVTILSSKPLSVRVQFENPMSAMALISANGLQLGDRTLSTRPCTASASPFEPLVANQWLDDDVDQSSQMPVTPESSSRSSRLNAESQPFIPGFKSTTILKPMPCMDLLAPGFSDKSSGGSGYASAEEKHL